MLCSYTYINDRISFINNMFDSYDSCDTLDSSNFDISNNLNENNTFIKNKVPIEKIRYNTSPDLTIKKNIYIKNNNSVINLQEYDKKVKIIWFCKECKTKITRYGNIYCCNDFLFCTPNCRDRFQNFVKINNNI